MQFFREYFGYEAARKVFKTLLITDQSFVNWSYSKKNKKGSKREKEPLPLRLRPVLRSTSALAVDRPTTDRPHLPPPWRLNPPGMARCLLGEFDTDPVKRGKWIRFQLLGGTVPYIPIGVDARIPEDPHLTLRARLHSATSAQEFWRCQR
jgi:hypothetical protein